ncbi:MAG: hypothetical protein M3Q55_14925 [Acidobacteriota bacterium]|nr:hypothetical protein [Acidobacteriota bacterium]
MTRSKLLLSASALFFGLAGAGATFLPVELLTHVRQPGARILVVFIQALGALYLALAMLNWMSRGATIGGIYGRPLVVANLLYFMMTGIVLARWAAESAPPGIMVLAAIHVLFAVCFGAVMFGSPKSHA